MPSPIRSIEGMITGGAQLLSLWPLACHWRGSTLRSSVALWWFAWKHGDCSSISGRPNLALINDVCQNQASFASIEYPAFFIQAADLLGSNVQRKVFYMACSNDRVLMPTVLFNVAAMSKKRISFSLIDGNLDRDSSRKYLGALNQDSAMDKQILHCFKLSSDKWTFVSILNGDWVRWFSTIMSIAEGALWLDQIRPLIISNYEAKLPSSAVSIVVGKGTITSYEHIIACCVESKKNERDKAKRKGERLCQRNERDGKLYGQSELYILETIKLPYFRYDNWGNEK